jgi:O-antigen ligase
MTILVIMSCLAVALAHHVTTDRDIGSLLVLLAPAGLLFLLSLITSAMRMPGVSGLREAALVMGIFLCGVFLSRSGGLDSALLGILLGATAGAGASWFLAVDDLVASLDGFSIGDVIAEGGFSGNRAIEYVSALMGIAAGLSLVRRSHWSHRVVGPMVVLLSLSLVASGSLTARFALVALCVALIILLLGRTRHERVAGWTAVTLAVAVPIFVVLSVVFRRGAVEIASFLFGKQESLDARLLSWQSIVGAVDPGGWIFGYGATFWLDGSPSASAANEPLKALNYGPFDISHSIYLDTLVSFGVVGVVVVALLIGVILRSATAERNNSTRWARYSAPWLFAAAIAVTGVTDSVIAYRPVGWLLLGLLYGAMLSASDLSQLFGRFSTKLFGPTSMGTMWSNRTRTGSLPSIAHK